MVDLVLTEARWLARTWTEGQGPRFVEALNSFIRSFSSEHTKRAYRYAIDEFWLWYAWAHGGHLPRPDQVTRAEAISYLEHLRTRCEEFDVFRVHHVFGDRGTAIYSAVRSQPGATRRDLAKPDELEPASQLLGELVHARVLCRRPTATELRVGQSDVVNALDVDPDSFHYYLEQRPPPDQPSTIAARISALSALWTWLADTGENVQGSFSAPLLQHNIWRPLLKRVSKQAASHKQVARATKTPDWNLFLKMLAATFHRTHIDPHQAAADCWAGVETTVAGTEYPTLVELRDRALLMTMVGTGLRSEEVGELRVGWLQPDGVLTVLGKGDKTRLVRLPSVCLRAVRAYQQALVPLASRRPRKGQKRQLAGLLSPDAPLFPAVRLWGRNKPRTEERGIGRGAVAAVLRRRARQAGIEQDSADWKRVHAHGLRHLAAHQAIDAGVPLPTVQAALGHVSLSSTGVYTEQHDPGRVCLVPDAGD